MLAGMGVFTSGATMAAVESVCGSDGDPVDALDSIQVLVESSLVATDEAPDEPRFRLLEVIREFALEKVGEAGEADELRRRHAEFFASLAETAAPKLESGEAIGWHRKLDADDANLRSALDWAIAAGERAIEQRLVAWLSFRWASTHDRIAHAKEHFARVLEEAELPTELRAEIVGSAALASTWTGDYEVAIAQLDECGALAESIGNDRLRTRVALSWDVVYARMGRHEEAARASEAALALCREVGDHWRLAAVLSNAAISAMEEGDFEAAKARANEAREIIERHGFSDVFGLHSFSAEIALHEDRLGDALRDAVAATELELEARRLAGVLDGLIIALRVCVRSGASEHGARLLGTIETAVATLSVALDPGVAAEVEQARGSLLDELGKQDFDAAWAAGAEDDPFEVATRLVSDPRLVVGADPPATETP